MTHVHPATPFWVYGTLHFGLLGLGIFWLEISPLSAVLWWLAGVVGWTLTEYLLHRFVFHFEASSPWGKRLTFLIHGVHHDHPNEADRLVAPPLMSVTLAIPIFGGLAYLLPNSIALAFLPGMMAGYLYYEYVHYSVHHRPARNRWERFLREYHLRHHHEHTPTRYGVSNPLWDWVFGTYRPLPRGRTP